MVHRRAVETGTAHALRFAEHVLDCRFGVRRPDGAGRGDGVRHWIGDRLLALIDALPEQGPAQKVAGLAYEALLVDRPGALSQLLRRRCAKLTTR